MEGILVLDKPAGISSARAVRQVKRLLPRGMKIGHAGTLDPFATGVLLLLVGKSTKLCEKLMDEHKEYEATVKFGANTATDDSESPEESHQVLSVPSFAEVTGAIQQFIGVIVQRPPVYSAMKIGGRRAYQLARKGAVVEIPPRPVKVYCIELIEYIWPTVSLRIGCGRGTYIRAIARDLGETLKVGGYVSSLRRTRIGPFAADNAVTLEQIQADGVEPHLQSYTSSLTPNHQVS
jgi:tRNA pseudouridine55 synthase